MGKIGNRDESFERIAELIYGCITGAGDTHRLDWVDAEIYGCIEKTEEVNGKRRFKVRMSEAAYKFWKTYFNDVKIDNLPHSKISGFSDWFHNEHVFPRKAFKALLLDKYENDPSNFNINFILDVIHKCGRGAIILKSEAEKLDSTFLKSSMPIGWNFELNFSPVECRLEQVGIKLMPEYFEVLDI